MSRCRRVAGQLRAGSVFTRTLYLRDSWEEVQERWVCDYSSNGSMFRNQYDTDITTWSPQGRLHQMEYAMEAVKQGSATVGVKSRTHVVIAALKKAPHTELSSYQKKVYFVDKHCGVSIAGLAADGRVLCKFMRNECMNHRFAYGTGLQVGRLVEQIADKSQICTQRASKRPFGVGMLVAAYDKTGAHLYQTCPSGNYFDWHAISIGARSQSAKTYLEKHFSELENLELNELVRHALLALRETLADDQELSTSNVSLGIVGEGFEFKEVDDDATKEYLDLIQESAPAAASTEMSDE